VMLRVLVDYLQHLMLSWYF